MSELSLGTATLVKLIKMLMLIPLLLVIRLVWRCLTATASEGSIPFP